MAKKYNLIINILLCFVLIYILYNMYIEYQYHHEYKYNTPYILEPSEFEDIIDNYKDCNLYNYYITLDDKEKEFFHQLINYSVLKYKDKKPKYTKLKTSFKNNVLSALAVTLLLKGNNMSALLNSFKNNTLLLFSNQYL